MQYDAPVNNSELEENLRANETLGASTLAAIQSLLGLDSDGETNVKLFDGTGDPADIDPAAHLIIVKPEGEAGDRFEFSFNGTGTSNAAWVFETDANITAHFNTIERVIAMGNGDDVVTVDGDRNTTLDGGNGNDSLVTSGGDDSVAGGNGNDTINTGLGADTIDGGEGYDVVELADAFADYVISTDEDGMVVIVSAADDTNSFQLENVELVQFSDQTVALVTNATDANTLSLYQGLLGRSAEAGGAEYWLQDVNSDGRTASDIANAFFYTEEFIANNGAIDDLSNEALVNLLYDNALGRDASEEEVAYWVNDLENGTARSDVVISIVGSEEASDFITSVYLIDGQV